MFYPHPNQMPFSPEVQGGMFGTPYSPYGYNQMPMQQPYPQHMGNFPGQPQQMTPYGYQQSPMQQPYNHQMPQQAYNHQMPQQAYNHQMPQQAQQAYNHQMPQQSYPQAMQQAPQSTQPFSQAPFQNVFPANSLF